MKILALLAVLLSFGCGGSSSLPEPDPVPTVDVAGEWSGEWESVNGGGPHGVELVLYQGEARVGGAGSLEGTTCFSSGAVDGEVAGSELHGSLSSNGLAIKFDVHVEGGEMVGSYLGVSLGFCTGDSGSLHAVRK